MFEKLVLSLMNQYGIKHREMTAAELRECAPDLQQPTKFYEVTGNYNGKPMRAVVIIQ